MKKKLLLSLLLSLLIVPNLNAENTSKTLFGLTKIQFKAHFEEKFKRSPNPKIWFNQDGTFCGNADSEMFLDQMVTVLEKTPLTQEPPFFLSTPAIFLYGLVLGILI